jgi:hypothetical protein
MTLAAVVTPSAATTLFTLPQPGTVAQVKAAVAVSTHVTTVSAQVDPPLTDVINNTPQDTIYSQPNGCPGNGGPCEYGDVHASKLVVLFGDSHAEMWLEAVAPIMAKDHYKLQLIWKPSCPVTAVPIPSTPSCVGWRTAMITTILHEKPKAVILAERTTNVPTPTGTYYTAAQWATALEKTIAQFKAAHIKVIMLGDEAAYANDLSPAVCLSQHPSAVQECATPLVNPVVQWADQEAAEKAAATHEHVGFVDPTPWLCTHGTCSPIIGKFDVYFDWSHIDSTYSAYLATVMGDKLKPLL